MDGAGAVSHHIMQRRFFLLSTVMLAVATPALAQPNIFEDTRPRSYALLNQAAPDFAFPKRGGGTARLSDYSGRALILYFGGLWCPDCVIDGANANLLAALAKADPRVDFLHVHTLNRFGRWGSIGAYFNETGYDYPVAFDASRDWSYQNYRIEWSPSFIVVDRAGIIRAWRTDLNDAATTRAFFAQAQRVAAS